MPDRRRGSRVGRPVGDLPAGPRRALRVHGVRPILEGMLIEHDGVRPRIDPTAQVAATAVLSGDVHVGPRCRILHGAILTSEGGPVELGEHCIVMENAVLRGTRRNPLTIGRHCLVGPHASLVGARIADEVFLATGCRVFNGAVLGERCEVRVNATVHLRTRVPPGATVPIGWVAVGDPARILPPGEHERSGRCRSRWTSPATSSVSSGPRTARHRWSS